MRKKNRTKPITAKEVWEATQKEPLRFRLTKKETAGLARGLNQAREGKLVGIKIGRKFSLRKFLSPLNNKIFTARGLENAVIKLFNAKLELFPTGYGPANLIEDALKRKIILLRKDKKYMVKTSAA